MTSLAKPHVDLRPAHILLVEDQDADAELAQISLSRAKLNIDLFRVKDGEEALRYLKHEQEYEDAKLPSLILLDLNLPGISGLDVLNEVKQDPKLLMIPVAVLTNSAVEEDIVKSYSRHANCYLRKPIDFEGFKTVVASLKNFWFTLVTLPSDITAQP